MSASMTTASTSVFDSSQYTNDHKFHLLLSASGSVATIKLPSIVTALQAHPNLSIRIILTASAAHFLAGQSPEQPSLAELRAQPNVDGIHLDEDEWAAPWIRGAKILHIELRRWADLLVVAPLSANTLAKMVAGLCDNLLLSTMRAWDVSGELSPRREVRRPDGSVWRPSVRRIVVAPAMNTAMWRHPLTARQVRTLEEEWGVQGGGWVQVLRPVEKELACGDTGSGAMRDWREVVVEIEKYFGLRESVEEVRDPQAQEQM